MPSRGRPETVSPTPKGVRLCQRRLDGGFTSFLSWKTSRVVAFVSLGVRSSKKHVEVCCAPSCILCTSVKLVVSLQILACWRRCLRTARLLSGKSQHVGSFHDSMVLLCIRCRLFCATCNGVQEIFCTGRSRIVFGPTLKIWCRRVCVCVCVKPCP